MKILFIHGWGCGPEMWHPVIEQLKLSPDIKDVETTSLDLGFYGPPVIPAGDFDLAVCHSFGLLWLLHQKQITADRLVVINGFTRFFAQDDFPWGTPTRILDRMIKKTARSPADVLSDFFDLCTASKLGDKAHDCRWLQPNDIEEIDQNRLSWGLDGLKNWDLRSQWEDQQLDSGRCQVLASTDDRVVSRQLTEICFAGFPIDWLSSDCHLLPLAAPQACIKSIQKVLATP